MYRRIFIFLLLALFLLAAPFTLSSRLRDTTSKVLAPIARPFQHERFVISDFFTNLSQISQLRKDNNSLETEVVTLQQQLSTSDQIKRENDTLKQELGVTGITRELPKVLAHVSIQGTDPLDRTFTIDVGSAQNIKVGQPVVSNGYLVGRIIEVRNQSSRVRSIVSSQSIVQAWIPATSDKGLLVGESNTSSLQKINQGNTIPNGSLVETSGLHGDSADGIIPLPQGILIGTTTNNLSKASDLTQSFQVQTGTDPSKLESVLVLITTTP